MKGYSTWGGYGTSNGEFHYPSDVYVDSSSYVYVVDADNDNVQKFDSNGGFVTSWGGTGTGNGQFWNPYGIGGDAQYIYVADTSPINRIQKFSTDGVWQAPWVPRDW